MELETLLVRTAPVDDPAPAALAAAREPMTAEAARLSSALARRTRRRRRPAVLVAAAAVIGAAVVVVVPGSSEPASARAVLLAAAEAAGEQPGDWQSAPYWRVVSQHRQGASSGAIAMATATAVAGTSDGARTSDAPSLPTDGRREAWIGHDRPGALSDTGLPGSAGQGVIGLDPASFNLGGEAVGWDGLFALTTDPELLGKQIRDNVRRTYGSRRVDSGTFVVVGDLLRESPAPPALRKALWQVAADVPDVELLGDRTDARGRRGVAVERDGTTYLFDPTTGALLEEREAAADYVSTYLEQGPADSAPAITVSEPKKPLPDEVGAPVPAPPAG
jgi:hypothetical protein